MPSLQTQYKLADLLKAISEGEKQVEIVRQVLAEKPDFEPYAAFKRIDRNSNSFITTYDLLDFLREHDVAVLEKDIRNLFKEHNTHSNDRVSYTEFLDILLPKASSVLRQLCTQRESYPVAQDQVLPYEVEWALARVFEKELDLISSTEILKQDLADRYDFDPSELYRCIDTARVGVIDFDLLYFFFKANRVPITDAEILALLRRTDKDVDGKLTFSEFRLAILSVNSPSAGASGRSPVRKAASRVASPQKKTPSRTANSSFLSNSVASNKRSNAEYIDYVYTSARKSAGSRSPSLGKSASPVRKTSTFDQSVKAMSPVRDSVTKRLQEANKQEMDRSLRESMRSSLYRTPTKREASPVRSPVFSPARSPVRSPARSPVRESEYASSPSRSPSRRQLSPMKGNEEEHLANALKEQIELDKDLETTKVDLALRRDFNLLDAFKFFDLAEKGSVCKSEIRDALNELGVFPTNDELYLVMRKFDKNNDGLIRFSDFRDMLTPKEGGYTELLNKREPTYADGAALTDIFSEQTLFLLKKTLNMIIKNEVYSESIRQRLNRRPLFDTWEGFKALDKDNNGYVRAYEFKDMLIEHGFYPSSKEVMNLVDRYDRNQDGKVSYSEFVNEISPKSPKKY